MDIKLAFTTIFGGFLLPFFMAMLWDKLVTKLDPAYGWSAIFLITLITGTIWAVNQGIKKFMLTVSTVIIGGILGGFILYIYTFKVRFLNTI